MRRNFYTLILLLSAFHFSSHAQNKLDGLTGIYRPDIDPSVEFMIKREGEILLLEIPGQGQTELVDEGNDRFRPKQIPVEMKFIRDASGRAIRFEWAQKKGNQPIEWIKLPGENQQTTEGRYRLKNNPYKMLTIKSEGEKLTSQTNEGKSFPMIDKGQGKYELTSGAYTIWYEITADKSGNISKVLTTEGGTLDFNRARDFDPVVDGGFSRPDGFTRADTLRGMLTPLKTCYDVLFYSLDVEIMPYSKSIKGSNTIRFKAVQSVDKMQVDLYANMQIEKIVYHQQELSYTREYNAVFIQFPKTIRQGAEDSVMIFYKGKPQMPNIAVLRGGFLWYQDRDGNPWIESVCQGSGASLWWPCKDHLSDESDSMKISVTIPDNLVDISNGKLLNTVLLPGNRKRFDWYVGYPINNYNVVVNIGNYTHFSDVFIRDRDSMQLHFYCLPYNLEPAKKIFGRTKELLTFLERSFGEYPFKRDNFTLMESLYPMEHQGAISMGSINNPFWSDNIDYAEVTRTAWHEVAHEWWGNNVTGKDIADIWIHEAFATYAEVMVTEFFEGKTAAQKLLRNQVPGNKEPVIGHYDVNDFRLGDVYPKGCMMVHTLRSIIDNDSTWLSLLRGLQFNFRYQTVTTADIVGYINKSLGQDLTAFFDQYLRHSAIPELQVKFRQDGNDLELQYRWKVDEKAFAMPVKVTTGKNDFSFIYPQSEWKTLRLTNMKQKDFKVDTANFLMKVSPE